MISALALSAMALSSLDYHATWTNANMKLNITNVVMFPKDGASTWAARGIAGVNISGISHEDFTGAGAGGPGTMCGTLKLAVYEDGASGVQGTSNWGYFKQEGPHRGCDRNAPTGGILHLADTSKVPTPFVASFEMQIGYAAKTGAFTWSLEGTSDASVGVDDMQAQIKFSIPPAEL